MKQYLIKILILGTLVAGTFIGVLSLADGSSDLFYKRLTTPRQSSLIIGTSRAAQGIRPQEINDILGCQAFNFSFSGMHSPYGPSYLNSIQRKLDTTQTNGIFILDINPWNVSSTKKAPNDTSKFVENDSELWETSSINQNPNYEFLINNMKGEYYKILLNKTYSSYKLHDNGWLELSLNVDSAIFKQRIKTKIKSYKKYTSTSAFSSARLKYLNETIEYLKQYGKVYLVRLPIHNKIMEIENDYMPDFNKKIKPAIDSSHGYFDMTIYNDEIQYTDGNHIYKESAPKVSSMIAKWIKML